MRMPIQGRDRHTGSDPMMIAVMMMSRYGIARVSALSWSVAPRSWEDQQQLLEHRDGLGELPPRCLEILLSLDRIVYAVHRCTRVIPGHGRLLEGEIEHGIRVVGILELLHADQVEDALASGADQDVRVAGRLVVLGDVVGWTRDFVSGQRSPFLLDGELELAHDSRRLPRGLRDVLGQG